MVLPSAEAELPDKTPPDRMPPPRMSSWAKGLASGMGAAKAEKLKAKRDREVMMEKRILMGSERV